MIPCQLGTHKTTSASNYIAVRKKKQERPTQSLSLWKKKKSEDKDMLFDAKARKRSTYK